MSRLVLPENFAYGWFLSEIWQQKPLLIRAQKPGFADLISAEELAGLACEAEVESRLVSVNADLDDWTLRLGPFSEQDFLSLPPTHYSLMVQAVDQWADEVSTLLDDFSFIPGWRLDDVMVSYSTDQGNVGPHFDYYDVFLIQGRGRKRWQLGDACDSSTPLRDHSGLKLLRDFSVQQEWILEPGDILYLPPGIAHYGVALGESMTYSVGFRAPSIAEMLSGLADEAIEGLNEDQRYRDRHGNAPTHSGEISPAVLETLHTELQRWIARPDLLRHWFGKHMTRPRYDSAPVEVPKVRSLMQCLRNGARLFKTPGSRFAYTHVNDGLELYADGELYQCEMALLPLLRALSNPGHVDPVSVDLLSAQLPHSSAEDLLLQLCSQGCIYLD